MDVLMCLIDVTDVLLLYIRLFFSVLSSSRFSAFQNSAPLSEPKFSVWSFRTQIFREKKVFGIESFLSVDCRSVDDVEC